MAERQPNHQPRPPAPAEKVPFKFTVQFYISSYHYHAAYTLPPETQILFHDFVATNWDTIKPVIENILMTQCVLYKNGLLYCTASSHDEIQSTYHLLATKHDHIKNVLNQHLHDKGLYHYIAISPIGTNLYIEPRNLELARDYFRNQRINDPTGVVETTLETQVKHDVMSSEKYKSQSNQDGNETTCKELYTGENNNSGGLVQNSAIANVHGETLAHDAKTENMVIREGIPSGAKFGDTFAVFHLYIPKKFGSANEVMMISNTECLTDAHFTFDEKLDHWVSNPLNFSFDSHFEPTYKYIAKFKGKVREFIGWSSEKCEETDYRIWKSAGNIQDSFDYKRKSEYVLEGLQHYINLMLSDITRDSLKSILLEWISYKYISAISLASGSVKDDFVSWICKEIVASNRSNYQILFLMAMLCDMQCRQRDSSFHFSDCKAFNQNVTSLCVDAIQLCHYTLVPNEFQDVLCKCIEKFILKHYESKLCIFSLYGILFPAVDYQHIINMKSKCHSTTLKPQHIRDLMLHLIGLAGKENFTEELLVDVFYAMKDVILMIEIGKTVLLSVVADLQHKNILLAINNNILESLKTFTSSKHLVKLNVMLLQLSDFEGLTEIKHTVEDHIIKIIRNRNASWAEDSCRELFKTIHCQQIFNEEESLLRVLKAVCDSNKPNLKTFFPQLLSSEKVHCVLRNDEKLIDLCVTIVKNIFMGRTNRSLSVSACQKKIEYGYKYLNKIVYSKVMSNNKIASEKIKEVAKFWLFEIDLAVATECSCQLPNDMNSSIFIEQMEEYLQKELSKAGSADLNKKLHKLLGSKRLTINIWTYKIVKSLLTQNMATKLSNADIVAESNAFLASVLSNANFWETIFHADGPELNKLRKHPAWINVTNLLLKLGYCMENGTLSCRQSIILLEVTKKANLLEACANIFSFVNNWDTGYFKNILETLKQDYKAVTDYLHEILNVMSLFEQLKLYEEPIGLSIEDLHDHIQKVKYIQNNLSVQTMSLKAINEGKEHLGEYNEIYGKVVYLKELLHNFTFIAYMKKELCSSRNYFTENDDIEEDSVSLAELYNEPVQSTDYEDCSQVTKCTVEKLIDFFYSKCIPCYENTVKTLFYSEENVPLKKINQFFCHNIKESEILKIERWYRKDLAPGLKSALRYMCTFPDILEKAKCLKRLCYVFQIATDGDADDVAQCIEVISKSKIDSEITLQQLHDKVEKIEKYIVAISEDEWVVIEELGKNKAKGLIDFLKDIIDDDLRNLMDAVEEFSEQYVQLSTVSDLNQVKRFLYPLLHEKAVNFQSLMEQVKRCKTKQHKDVALQMANCQSNLHGLKVLYKSVENRGEVTKETIKNILNRGIVRVFVTHEKKDLYIQCTKDKQKKEYCIADLEDLRSRCLLISNTEKSDISVQQDMKCFLEIVDIVFDIWELANNLHNYGNFNYQKFVWKTSEQSQDKRLEEICLKKETLTGDIDEWQHLLQIVREKEYYSNFIHSEQIWILQEYFEKGLKTDRARSILHFLSPDAAVDHPSDYYDFNYSQAENPLQRKLENLAGALNKVMQYCSDTHIIFPSDRKFTVVAKNIEANVESGKLYMAHSDAKSAHFVPILLSLYFNTSGKFPKPHEVLLCNNATSWEEIQLFLNRCTQFNGKSSLYNLHVIVGIEHLQNEVKDKLVIYLHALTKLKNKSFQLGIICHTGSFDPLVIEFSRYVHRIPGMSDGALRHCLQQTCPSMYMITSDLPGLGKTEYIFRNALQDKTNVHRISINGKLDKQTLTNWCNLNNIPMLDKTILHLDIGVVENPELLDAFLFEFLVLRCAVSGTLVSHLAIKEVAIEVASTLKQQLRDDLFVISCFKRIHLEWQDLRDLIVSQNMRSPVQIVCQYLHGLRNSTLGSHDIVLFGQHMERPVPPDVCRSLLRECLETSTDISFSIVAIFLNVLSQQLLKFACSAYFKVSNLRYMLKEETQVQPVIIKIVNALVEMSKEFACRSVHTCRSSQNVSLEEFEGKQLNSLTRAMLQRVDGMIRWTDTNHLLIAFHSLNIQSVTLLYRDLDVVPDHMKELFELQMKRKLENFDKVDDHTLQHMLENIACRTRVQVSAQLGQLARKYALTPDNLLKMVLIIMRIRANVPVVLMGETGCGKTTLVRYLARTCGVTLNTIPLHAGSIREEICHKIIEINNEAKLDRKKEFWLFLDEINTCSFIGFLNNILCHRHVDNVPLSPNIKCIAACNPYRLRNIESRNTSGLNGKSCTDQLSPLVYRVHPLPETMIDYVWDYGTLSPTDEEKYISRMVVDVYDKFSDVTHTVYNDILVNMLKGSQSFIRECEKSESAVSLRDIYRCCCLIKWFYKMLKQKAKYSRPDYVAPLTNDTYVRRSVLLALSLCYALRLQDMNNRKLYWKRMGMLLFQSPTNYADYIMYDIIMKEQLDILKRMEIGEGIAANMALIENVFAIFVCIMNKIPIFVVGKPGCSKSLSMQLIKSNLRGPYSDDSYFQTLPEVYVASYQGSESSTSDGIIKVFEKAERYRQKQKEHEQILPVVLLDEIGLAESSKDNPLKVLHNLLEPEGDSFPDVAVVGISNWTVDAAKMNRAIHLARPDLSQEELYNTGISINRVFRDESGPNVFAEAKDQTYLKALSKVYFNYHEHQTIPNFHGLRDYYSMVKYISKQMTQGTDSILDIIEVGLLRNFGGLPNQLKANQVVDSFMKQISAPINMTKRSITISDLILSNVTDPCARNLMLITSGDSIIGEIGYMLEGLGKKVRTLFGSSFEEDQKDQYCYRMLSAIIHCMANGIALILKDLDDIYGSLYDMLNQNYSCVGKKRYCRIALGAHTNPICHVHEDFRCIVLVESKNIDYSDPPFLNRFEKQCLFLDDLLSEKEVDMVNYLKDWVNDFSTLQDDTNKNFGISHAFLGYHENTISSLVMSVRSKHSETEDMLQGCKSKLLLTCTPDAVLRLPYCMLQERDEIIQDLHNEYFNQPLNDGINNALGFILTNDLSERQSETSLKFVCFTRSNIHTDLNHIINDGNNVQLVRLAALKSEREMTFQIDRYFDDTITKLLVIQCSVKADADHILLAKLQIENKRSQYISSGKKNGLKHVCFLVHLEYRDTKSVGAQFDYSGGWMLFAVDVLDYGDKVSFGDDIYKEGTIKSILNKSKTELLRTEFQPIDTCIKENMLWAFTCLHYTSLERNPDSIKRLVSSILRQQKLIDYLCQIILKYMKEKENADNVMDSDNWQVQVACNAQLISEGYTMIDAFKKYLEEMVKVPLARLVWYVEKMAAWDCIVMEESKQKFSDVWFQGLENIFHDDQMEMVSPQGIMSLSIPTPPLKLKYPFARLVLLKLKDVSKAIEDNVYQIKHDIDSVNEMEIEKLREEILLYSNLVEQRLQDTFPFSREQLHDNWDVIMEDFCNEFSWYKNIDLEENTRKRMFQKFVCTRIERLGNLSDISKLSAFLIVLRVEQSRIWAFLKLISMCEQNVCDRIYQVMDFQTQSSTEYTSSDDDSRHDKEDAHYIEDEIAEVVLQSVLPYSTTLQQLDGMKGWYESASLLLLYCHKIGGECDTTNFIRFCFDLVDYFIEPDDRNYEILSTFTKYASAVDGKVRLDAKDAFEYLCGIIKQERSDPRHQKLICLYFARVLEYNPKTELLSEIMNIICQNKLPMKNMDYIGPFIHIVMCKLEDFLKSANSIADCRFENHEDKQLRILHTHLSRIEQTHPLFVICTDIVNSMMQNRDTDMQTLATEFEFFSKVLQSIQTDVFKGLSKMIRLVYIKQYLENVICCLKYPNVADHTGTFHQIDSCLLGENNDCLQSTFYMLLLQKLCNTSIKELQKECKEFQVLLPGMNTIMWPEDNIALGIGFNIFSTEDGFNEILNCLKHITVESNKDIIQQSMTSSKQFMPFVGALATLCYWPKYVTGHRKDTHLTLCSYLEEHTSTLPKHKKQLIMHMCGNQDFMTDLLNINAELSYTSILQASLITHIMFVLVSYNENTEEERGNNVFTVCMFQPYQQAKNCTIPQHFIAEGRNRRTSYFKCRYQHYLVTKQNITRCTICGSNDIKQFAVGLDEASQERQITVSQLMDSDFDNKNGSQEVLNNLIKLVIEGCLLAGINIGNGYETWDDEALSRLKSNFHQRWESLQAILCNHEQRFTFLLHKMIKSNQAVLTKSVDFSKDHEMEVYSHEVTTAFTHGLLESGAILTDFITCVLEHSTEPNLSEITKALHSENALLETREVRKPTVEHMLANMHLNTQLGKFTFLHLVLMWEKKLKLLKNIRPILSWQLAIHSKVNHSCTRQESNKINVHQFIHEEKSQSEVLNQKYEEFRKALKVCGNEENNHTFKSFGVEIIPTVNFNTPISDYVIENNNHYVVSILKALVGIQNQFLSAAAQLSLQNHPALKFLCKRFVVGYSSEFIEHLRSRDIINLEWNEHLLRFSQNVDKLGSGNEIIYDLEQIERELAIELLLGKPYITIPDHLFKTIFRNEMFHWCSYIFKDIDDQIKQEPITSDMKNSIIKGANENPESLRSILDYLQIVISMLFRTGGNPDDSINTYAQSWHISKHAITSKTIMSQMKGYIKLCHIVSLYEFLEDKLAYIAIELIPSEYCKDLSSNAKSGLMEFIKSEVVPLAAFETAVKRLISRYVCVGGELTQVALPPKSQLINIICQPPLWSDGVDNEGILTCDQGKVKRTITQVFPDSLLIENTSDVYHRIKQHRENLNSNNNAQYKPRSNVGRSRRGNPKFF